MKGAVVEDKQNPIVRMNDLLWAFKESFTNERKQKEMMLGEIGKQFKNFDDAFGIIIQRIESLEAYTLFTSIYVFSELEGQHIGQERCKGLASMLSIDWDSFVKNNKKDGDKVVEHQ